MRAVVVNDPAPADDLKVIELPNPEPGPGEIGVKIAAAGVNPIDLMTLTGQVRRWGFITEHDQVGLGWELAGTVSAVGESPDGMNAPFAVGDQVAALYWGADHASGAYAEQAVVPVAAAARVPDGLSLLEAATVPLNGLAALQGIALLGEPDGRTLLVTGAAGSVGGYAVALAARLGWHVTGLARETDHDFVFSVGAADFITEPVGAYDAVFDPAVLADAAVALVKDGGRYVGVATADVPDGAGRVRTEAVGVTANSAELAGLLADTANGAFPIRIQGTFPLEQAALAHKTLEAGGGRGRYLLIP